MTERTGSMADQDVAPELGRQKDRGDNDLKMETSGSDDDEKATQTDCWRWVMLVCSFILLSFCLGLNYGLWPLVEGLREFYQDYNYDTEGVDPKWIVYINIVMIGITAPFASALVYSGEHGARIAVFCGAVLSTLGLLISAFVRGVGALCATYGLIAGIGYGLLLTPSVGLLPIYFSKCYTLANALAFSGTSLCIFYMPPLFDSVAEMYGLHSMFLILACFNAHLVITALLYRPVKQFSAASSPKYINRLKRLKKELFSESDSEYVLFSTIIVSMFFIGVGYNILLLHLRQFVMFNGTSATDSATVMNVCGIFMVIGQLLHGLLSYAKAGRGESTYRRFCFSVSLFAVSLVCLLSSVAESFAGHVALAAFIGLGIGVYFPLMFVLLRHSLGDNGESRLMAALAIGLPFFGVGALCGLPIGDLLNEGFQNYNCSFFLAGAALLLVFCIMAYKLVAWIREQWKTKKSNRTVGVE